MSSLLIAVFVALAPAPLESSSAARPGSTPFESGERDAPPPNTPPPTGASPLEQGGSAPPREAEGPSPATPFGRGTPARKQAELLDPRAHNMVRVDLTVGMAWRTRQTEPVITTSLEYGRMQGVSGSFHASIIIAPDRDFVRAIDLPIGLGAVLRGRLRKRPIYGSVGLSAGILVHRAQTFEQVVHRVDPDLRLPIRFAWTVARVGFTLALVQGYSFRNRSYVRRGVPVWERSAYRIGLDLGLHFDIVTGPAKRGERKKSRAGRPKKDNT